MVGFWRRLGEVVIGAVFPRTCVRCGVEGTDVCATCLSVAHASVCVLHCPACGEVSPIGATHPKCTSALDGLIAAAPYADPVVHGLLRRWKFHFVRSVEPFLAGFLERSAVADVLMGDDWVVVPIPLHKRRKRERGFDQAAWIAKWVGDYLHLPAVQALRRVRSTTPQSHQKVRKQEDFVGVFEARQRMEGRVILCDDVFTSGATMESAARACREAGATSVWGVVIARGGERGKG